MVNYQEWNLYFNTMADQSFYIHSYELENRSESINFPLYCDEGELL